MDTLMKREKDEKDMLKLLDHQLRNKQIPQHVEMS